MEEKEQAVTIRGTRDGLTFVLNDLCSYAKIITDLKAKLSQNEFREESSSASVLVQLGNRYLTEEQRDEIKEIINSSNNLKVDRFESKVISKQDAIRWKEKSEIKAIRRIVRSGQVLDVEGDLLLIGDVNPGGMVRSTGNIYILGHLRGIAHAGSAGDREAIVVASYMKPNQLRIAHSISRSPDYESAGVYMEYGRIDESLNKIVLERLQLLSTKQNSISGFERRIQNG